MSDSADKHDEPAIPFLQRWSQRKQQQHNLPEPQTTSETDVSNTTAASISEEDLPAIESLHEDSEISMFLNEGISETLQRQALRKLFHLGKFNVCDGLDDYADDYNIFEKLNVVLDTQEKLREVHEKLTSATANQPDASSAIKSESDHIASSTAATASPDNNKPMQDEETEES